MIAPINPALFGAPFPAEHPWSATVGHTGWEVVAPRAHVLREGGGCTLCRRGLPRCEGVLLRVTTSWERATCARCIKIAMHADGRHEAVAATLAGLKGRFRENAAVRLARAIGWWRMCGVTVTSSFDWLGAYFVSTDRDVFTEAQP